MPVPKVNSSLQDHSSPEMSEADKKLYSEVTIDNKKIYHCLIPDCGKAFKFLSEMKRHLTVHTKQRPYTCSYPECGKTFKRADALSNHFRIHSRNTPFNCTEEGCDAQFVTKSALRYHMLKHNGERTFKCNQEGCDKTFMTQAQLKQHEKASVYHQRIADGSSPSDEDSENFRENGHFDGNDDCGKSEFLSSYNNNFEGNDDQLDNHSDSANYLEHVYQQITQGYEETSSVETNETPLFERLRKRNGDPNLLSMLQFVMEENKQLKKKLKSMQEVPRYESTTLEFAQKPQSDVDSFFRNPTELDADQDPFLNFQPTFLY